MQTKFSGSTDPFSLSPLMALLTTRGRLSRLESLSSSLFARQERVDKALSSVSDRVTERKLYGEAAMLKQILEWLEVTNSGAS